jgi:5-methylcytosine-specific restriction protein A
MPTRPGKACRKTGCPNIAKAGKHQGYCNQHKDSAGWHLNERMKGNATARGYGADWRKLRQIVLQRDNHLCLSCLKNGRAVTATDVDHIKPKAQGGTNTLNNLQSLCADHHRAKTALERT